MNPDTRLIIDRSVPGRVGVKLPRTDVPATDPAGVLAAHLLRRKAAMRSRLLEMFQCAPNARPWLPAP